MTEPEIRYVKWGFATCKLGDKPIIYMNSNLKKYPKLHDEVLAHELDHARQDRPKAIVSMQDMVADFACFNPNNWARELPGIWFLLIHPTTWVDLLPIKIRKTTQWDISVCPPLMWLWCIFTLIELVKEVNI